MRLDLTRAIGELWHEMLVTGIRLDLLDDLEVGITNFAKDEWGYETTVRFDRERKAFVVSNATMSKEVKYEKSR